MASMTSGAIQYGVPTNELAGHLIEALPKSASFTVPFSVNRMLPAFTSLHTSHNNFTLLKTFEYKLYQPMYAPDGVEITEAVEDALADGRDLVLAQRTFVHLEDVGGRAEAVLHHQPGRVVPEVAAFVFDGVRMLQLTEKADRNETKEPKFSPTAFSNKNCISF